MNSVEIRIPSEARYSALRQSQIIVDDGTATDLQLKGDGVQSLAAMSLSRHLSQELSGDRELIFAVEEPEAHLHPKAIHQVKGVLVDIARKQQVVVTTHSPLLTNRLDIGSNIIVDRSRARAAKNIRELRDVLGVRVFDNLSMASVVLVLEGESDVVVMRAFLSTSSKRLQTAIDDGSLALDMMSGSGNLPYKLSQLSDAMCLYHVLLDNDSSGRTAAEKAETDGLLDAARRTLAIPPDQADSEIEDLFDPAAYEMVIKNTYNVDIGDKTLKGKSRWSERMKRVFIKFGQPWNDQVARQVKLEVARVIAADVTAGIRSELRGPLDAVVAALEGRLSS